MKIVYVGDCAVDIYPCLGKKFPGGCALNFAVNGKKLARPNLELSLVSAVGNDENKNLVLETLKSNNINTDYIHSLKGKTPVQYIKNTRAGEKIFTNYEEGVLRNFSLSDRDKKFIKTHDVLVSVVYKQVLHLFKEVMGVKFPGIIVVDFMDLVDFGKDPAFVEKYIRFFDVGFFGLEIEDEEIIRDIFELGERENKMMVVTLGKNGSKTYWMGKIYSQPALSANVIDTTGCGDAYLAGFLTELLKSKDIQKSMLVGAKLAAQTAEHCGGCLIRW